MEELDEKIELIQEYLETCEGFSSVSIPINIKMCKSCCALDECYDVACQRENSEWAKTIDYGGYDTEDEFWEQLLG